MMKRSDNVWEEGGGRKDETGFSLLELLVVLGVMAVLAATAVPLLTDNIPRFQLKSAARVLLADFQRAKVEAVKRNCNVEIRFSPGVYNPAGEVGSYQIVEMCNNTTLLSRNMPRWVSLYQTNFTSNTTGYQPDGLPIRTGSVWLRNNKSVYYQLALSVAGNVSLSMGELP